jgi:mono/diheme cytochrome c family protein
LSEEQTALISKGRTVYQTSCTACHHSNPKKSGTLGPDVYGSSLELLSARILKAEYPPGYTPKRSTQSMAALPHLAKDLPGLHAYLNSEH